MARRAIGIDVGGTKCLGVVWDGSSVVSEIRFPTPHGPEAVIETLVSIVTGLEEVSGPCDTVGVGVPGLVTRAGLIRASPNLAGADDFAVGPMLSSRLGRSVWVDNDATAAAVAEWKAGAAVGRDDACVVTLGTGIGGGLIVGGRLVRGENGFAGEIGHMVVEADGVPCPCGRKGCWERYASGSGLAHLARESARRGVVPRMVEIAGSIEAIRGEHVRQAAIEGDQGSRTVVDDFGRWVAIGLVNLANILDPGLFVVGGGLVSDGDLFLGPIRDWFARLLYSPGQRPHPEVVAARFGESAGAVGAALLPSC